MTSWLRRVRGAIGTGITWALGWAPVGAVVGFVVGTGIEVLPTGTVALSYAALFAVCGFIGGATLFANILRIAEGERSFDQLSLPRFVGWGALGGALLGVSAMALELLGVGFGPMGLVVTGVTTLLGAGSAAGSLLLARSASPDPRLETGQAAAGALPDVTGAPGRT